MSGCGVRCGGRSREAVVLSGLLTADAKRGAWASGSTILV